MSRSFYITGGTLPDTATCYVERTADRELLDGILNGSYVYALDTRQMGKSSLCIRTLHKLNDLGIHTAFVDLTKFGVRNITAEQWYIAMLREIGRGLNIGPALVEAWKANADVAPVQRFFGAIQDVALVHISGMIAIFIDEIDVTRSLPFDTDEFFAGIRQCYVGRATNPELSRLTFSLFGTATPVELIEDTRVSPFNIGVRVDLKDFTEAEAYGLAEGLARNRQAVLRRILYWTGGHPYLTQKLCQVVAQSGAEVDDACASLFFEGKAKESDDNLAFVRNRLLKHDGDLGALLELYGKLLAGKVVIDDETNPLCAVLRMSGIARSEGGRLRVRNRIYSDVFDLGWIQKHLPDAEVRRQKAAYRRGIWRATAIAAAALSLVGGLAVYAFRQAAIAGHALGAEKRLTEHLTSVQGDLTKSLKNTERALGSAQKAQADAKRSADIADRQTKLASQAANRAEGQGALARSAAKNASLEATHAREATDLANRRLSQSLIATAMQRLDSKDPIGAIAPLRSALELDVGDAHRSAIDRLRLAYALRASSTLRQVWSGRGKMIGATYLSRDRVLTANTDGAIGIWNDRDGAAISNMSHPGLTCFAVAPDGRHVLTGGAKEVRWWDSRTGRLLQKLRTSEDVSRVAVSSDGTKAAVAFHRADKPVHSGVRIWDFRTGVAGEDIFDTAAFVGFEALTFSPDDRRILVGSGNFLAYSIDIGDGQGDHSISNCYSTHQAVFLKGGKAIVVNGGIKPESDGLLQACLPSGSPFIKYHAGGPQDGLPFAFRLSRDGKTLVVVTTAGALVAFDVKTGVPRGPIIRTQVFLSDCDISSSGAYVVAGGADGTVRAWDVKSGAQLGNTNRHGAAVTTVRFNYDASKILSAGEDGTARVWTVTSPGLRHFQVGPERYKGRPDYRWTPQGALIASDERGSYEWRPGSTWRRFLPGYIQLYLEPDSTLRRRRTIFLKGNELRVFDFDADRFVTPPLAMDPGFSWMQSCDALSRDSRYLYHESRPGHARILDLDHEGKTVSRIDTGYPQAIERHLSGAGDNRVSTGSTQILPKVNRVVTNGQNGQLDLWNLQTGKHIASLCPGRRLTGYLGSTDESHFITHELNGSGGATSYIFRTADGRLSPLAMSSSDEFTLGYLNGDGTRTVSPDFHCLYETDTGRLIRKMPGSWIRPWIRMGDFTDVSGRLVVDHATKRLYEMETGAIVDGPPLDNSEEYVKFSASNRLVAVSSPTSFSVYDLTAKRLLAGPIFLGSLSELEFSPDSELLLTRTGTRSTLWDPYTGEEVVPPFESRQTSFSPDGTKLVSLINDSSYAVWDLSRKAPDIDRLARVASRSLFDPTHNVGAKEWAKLRAELQGYSDDSASPPTVEGTPEETFSVEEAIRDLNSPFHDFDDLTEAARKASRAGQWQIASDMIGDAMQQGADSQGGWYLKGMLAIRQRRFDVALDALGRVVKVTKEHIALDPYFCAAVATKRFDLAVGAYSSPIAGDDPARYAVYQNLGFLALAAQGNIAGARAGESSLIAQFYDGEIRGYRPTLGVVGVVSAILDLDQKTLTHLLQDLHTGPGYQDSTVAMILLAARCGVPLQPAPKLNAEVPEPALAIALLAKPLGAGEYRSALRKCLQACDRVLVANDCSSVGPAVAVLQATVMKREVEKRLAELR